MTTQIMERRKKTILYLQIQTYINQNKFILYFIHAKMKQNIRNPKIEELRPQDFLSGQTKP